MSRTCRWILESGCLLVLALCPASYAYAQPGPIHLVKDIDPTGIPFRVDDTFFGYYEAHGSWPRFFAQLGDRVVFWAYHHDYGEDLWVSDGTAAGTKLLADFCGLWLRCGGDAVNLAGRLGDLLLLSVIGEGTGQELWRTDGTPEGTFLLADACPGSCSSRPVVGAQREGLALFGATDPQGGRDLWRTDGTPEGTFQLADFPRGRNPVYQRPEGYEGLPLAGALYFTVRAPNGWVNLWRTDGTPAGTVLFRTLCPTACTGSPGLSFVYRDWLYFRGLPGELWRTDGTAEGTVLLEPGAVRGWPVATYRGQLITAEATETGLTLYRGDATAAGTTAITTLPGVGGAHAFLEHRGELYFLTGIRLWKTDGTEEGTRPLLAVQSVYAFQRWKDRLLFWGKETPQAPRSLWVTDGTPEGSGRLDFSPELTVRAARVADGRLLLTATDTSHGTELWLSDGTPQGTRLIQDLSPGPESSWAYLNGDLRDGFFIQATRPETGYEPYAIKRRDLAPNRCLDDPDVLCLLDGRFEVRARFVDPREPSAGEKPAGSLISSEASGRFWFFDAKSSELVVKLLDGRAVNGHFWFFWGALSDVEYSIDLKDWATGATRTFHNPRGQICGGAEVEAFPAGTGLATSAQPALLRPPELLAGQPIAARDPEPRLTPREDGPTSRCDPGPQTLCLLDGKIEVKVDWEHPTLGAGTGRLETTDDTSAVFSFFGPGIPELVVKLLDGGPINGHYWLFSGALSDVEYRLHLREVATGRQRTFVNQAGQLCGIADVEAL